MIYKLADDAKFITTEDGAYFENTTTGEKYVIGGAGIDFVKLIDGKRDMDDILEELLTLYGDNVEPYVLAKDLERFMLDLVSNDLAVLCKSI